MPSAGKGIAGKDTVFTPTSQNQPGLYVPLKGFPKGAIAGNAPVSPRRGKIVWLLRVLNEFGSYIDCRLSGTNEGLSTRSTSPSGKSYRELITFVTDRPGHDYRYSIDASKIEKELNWMPNESFETGILKTILWYLEHQDWWQEIQENIYEQERLGAL